jgi:hypothetical protein
MDDLPTLYVYDHCPFCVRVRAALGIKNVKHNLHFLANDDIPTPTSLVGKKIAPIFVSRSENCLCVVVFVHRCCVWFVPGVGSFFFCYGILCPYLCSSLSLEIPGRRYCYGRIDGYYRID